MHRVFRGLTRSAAIFLFVLSLLAVTVCAEDVAIDISAVDTHNIVVIQYKPKLTADVKVTVEKGGEKYVYTIKDNNPVTLPLQMGNGAYSIRVLENIGGAKYRPVAGDTVNVTVFDENKVYTNSIQIIHFNSGMTSIKDLSALSDKGKNTNEKIDIIYRFIIGNIEYDYDLVKNLPKDYVPVIDVVYARRKGICYGYASLFASALRSFGVPAKLQMGYCAELKEYHAWNEILIDGKWVKVDTTYDAAYQKAKLSFSMVKDNKKYSVVRQY